MSSVKMGGNFVYVAVLGLVLCAVVNSETNENYTICAGPGNSEMCKLAKNISDIKCDTLLNQFDCLVNNNTTAFATITYEAILNNKLSDDIFVLAEVLPENVATQKTGEIEIVVVVKDSTIKSFKDLKHSKVCYPGLRDANLARYFISDFENALLNSVDPNLCLITNYPFIGKHVKGLHDFFSESCRPGPWVHHEEIDSALKSTYSKLCKLCGPTEDHGCSTLHVDDPFDYSLTCFKNTGNVAVLTKELASTLLSPLYLTANGSVSKQPYVWFRKPWPVLVANKRNPDRVIISSGVGVSHAFLPKSSTLKSYLEGINNATVKPKCAPKLNWCTNTNYETEECELLREVVALQKMQVEMECVEKIDKLACINSVYQNETDILTVQNSYGYVARGKLLEPLAYPSVNVMDASKSMVVVLSEKNDVKGFKDLKDKFGCFSQFADVAFSSWVYELKKQNLIKKSCTLDDLLMTFLGVSCVPGIINPEWEKLPDSLDITKFCKCAGGPTSKTDIQCSASYDNEYYGNEGALRCLKEIGNYAVVTNYEIDAHLNDTKFSILCKNGVIRKYNEVPFDDGDCFLSMTTNVEIMIRKRDILRIDYLAVLADLEALPKQYGLFNKLKNLMFKNSVPLLHFNTSEDKYISNYLQIFTDLDKCTNDQHYSTNLSTNLRARLCTLFAAFIVLRSF